MDTLCLDVKRLSSVYCGAGTPANGVTFVEMPPTAQSVVGQGSTYTEAIVFWFLNRRRCRLDLIDHRLGVGGIQVLHTDARSSAASKIPSASHRHIRYSYLCDDRRGRAGNRNQRADSADLRSSIRPRECAPYSDTLCLATSHSGLGPSCLADDCVASDCFYGSQRHCRILLYLLDGLHRPIFDS